MTHPTPTGEERNPNCYSCGFYNKNSVEYKRVLLCPKCKKEAEEDAKEMIGIPHTPTKEGWNEPLEELFNKAVSLCLQQVKGEITEEERKVGLAKLDEEGKKIIRQFRADLLKGIEEGVEKMVEENGVLGEKADTRIMKGEFNEFFPEALAHEVVSRSAAVDSALEKVQALIRSHMKE